FDVEFQWLREAGGTLGLEVLPYRLTTSPVTTSDLTTTLDAMLADGVDAVRPGGYGPIGVAAPVLNSLATARKLPTLYADHESTARGGLLGLETDILKGYERAVGLADKILRGTKAVDLPFERENTLSLMVNLHTAKAIGLTIPQAVLDRATRIMK